MSLIDGIKGLISNNPIASVGTAAAVGVATGVGAAALIGAAKKRKRKKITHTKRGMKQDRARRSKQKWEVAYRKKKRKSSSRRGGKKIYYAKKTGQPYILLANGQAKFIKGKRRKR